jgi:uncharacterized protein
VLLGTLSFIRRYPVASLRGERLDVAEIGERGIPGDRAKQLVVASGHVRVGRKYRGMEDERLHLVGDVDEAIALARERGVELRVESGGPFYFDGAISLIFDRWIDEVSAHLGYAVEPERFRPNFFARGQNGFALVEDDLVGKELDVGEVRLRVRKPISRCVVTTYDPHGGPSDPRILRFVAQQRDAKMGVYCDVLRAGTARTGDSVRLAER